MVMKLHADGSFDVTASGLELRGCYPAMDSAPIRTVHVETYLADDGGTVVYRMEEGTLTLRLRADGQTLVISTILRGIKRAPWFVQPLSGEVRGAKRFFRQGLGFSGPSGFVNFPAEPSEKELFSLESYLMSGVVAADGTALAIAALDHTNYLQKTACYARQARRGLINRHLEKQTILLEAAFTTENIPTPSGELVLPDLHLATGPEAWQVIQGLAKRIGTAMRARTHREPRYHYCSWYEKCQFYSRKDLDEILAGLRRIDPPLCIQGIQIDDGYCTARGDWLEPNERWPGGMKAAFQAIREAGYEPGVWVGPFMVGCTSRLYREHPDWIIRWPDGRPYIEWKQYNGSLQDHESYALDASHPEVVAYLGHVFRTLREWGATMFKTDFMDWGLKDSARVKRHNPDKTSVQCFREVLSTIRNAIGEESYWLACISPYAPFLGFADGMRVANDVGPAWGEGSTGNMIQESDVGQYFNHVWWQNDPDVLHLRDWFTDLSETEVRAIAYWDGILGGSVNTSDTFHRLRPDRLALWRFVRPGAERVSARLPYWGQERTLKVAVRPYGAQNAWAVLALNPTRDAVTDVLPMRNLVGREEAFVFSWSHEGAQRLGVKQEIVAGVPAHGAALYYLSPTDTPPPPSLTLGGYGG